MEPKREGHHPREPRRRARDHPTAGADAHDCGDQEDDTSPEYQHTDDEEDPDDPKALRKDIEAKDSTVKEGQERPQRLSRRGRGPPQEQRSQPAPDAEPAGEENPPDWTRFDVKVSLKNLRSNNMNVVRTELRKLHLRW